MAETVKFDPGLGELTFDFNQYVNIVYSQMALLKQFNQKKAKFRLAVPKIKLYMKNCIAFYLGCLLWAYFINKSNIDNPKAIEGNDFLNMTKEQTEEYDFLNQINFMENYFDCYERDTQYYCGKKDNIPERWKNILLLYKEFITLNNGFIAAKSTSDILLPEKLNNINFDFDINEVINKAINEKNLEIILNTEKIPF